MSDEDSTSPDTAPPSAEVQNEEPKRGRGRHKPPHREASAEVPNTPSDKEVIDFIARVGPDRILAILDPGETEKKDDGPKKLSHFLEAIDPEDAEVVIDALNTNDLKSIESLIPELAGAIRKNSADRRKPIDHSMQIAAKWLSERHGNATKVD